MKLISFDIGIKNMAYCIFYFDNTLQLTGWDVLNLMNDEEIEKHPCLCINKNKKVCGKQAIYKKTGIYYCKKHTDQEKNAFFLLQHNYTASTLKKMKIQELREVANTLYIESDSTRPFLLDQLLKYVEQHGFEKVIERKQQHAQDNNLVDIGRNMTRLLDAIPEIESITHVIMENQISPIATRMKTIQGMLAQYFIMRCPLDTTIDFISSANKLKGLVSSVSGGYKENKKNSILYCLKFIESNPSLQEWKEQFQEQTKADDRADSFLQGVWWLKKREKIKYDENFVLTLL